MEKKKIAILSAFYEPYMSGAEQMVKEIVENLGDRYEMILVTGRFDKKLARVEQRKTFKLIRVGIGHKQIDKLLYPLLAALRTRRFAPVIAHAIMESYAGGALVLLKYLYPRARRILTLQSGDLDSDMKQGQKILRLFFGVIHRSPHIVTAISRFLGERAKRLGVPEERIIITPNGVYLSAIPQGAQRISHRVICVARLSWEKGLDYLVRAWPEVLAKVPDARLVLVGEGDKRGEIESLIKELKIGDCVELKGNLPHDRVLDELVKSEVFICPSLAEGLGIVFIEAQACGLAVVGTNVGGIPDVITDRENGLLIEPKDSAAIGRALVALLTDQELARGLVARARQSVKKFDWLNVLKQIDGLYQNTNHN